MTPTRTTGILFLAAFLFYGVGTLLATGAATGSQLWGGVALMLLNSAAVIAIGWLLKPYLKRSGGIYLAVRIVEGVLLAAGAVALLLGNAEMNFYAYNVGMAILGFGSLYFCWELYRERLVPRFLAIWGLVGYTAFGIGSVLELLGVSDAGMYGAAPGGLFEVAFGIWLIARGLGAGAVSGKRQEGAIRAAARG